jgi:uncharacterized membrane protein
MNSSDLRYQARQTLAGKWGVAVLAGFLAALLGGLVVGNGAGLDLNLEEEELRHIPRVLLPYIMMLASIGGILGIVRFIVGGPVKLGYCRFLLKMHDGEDAQVGDLFSRFDRFGDGFCLELLTSLYIILWSLLFIIPGIIKAYAYAMAPFILEENPNMTPSEAIKASRQLMDGHKFDLFCLVLSFIGWDLLNLLTLGIGSLWLIPYKNAAHAAFYRAIAGRPEIIAE